MNSALGSSVDANASGSSISNSNVRAVDAVVFTTASLVALFLLLPSQSHALVLWESTSTHQDGVQIYTPDLPHRWFNGSQDEPALQVGTWSADNFTADASTSLHMWVGWNGISSPQLDVILKGSSGGDPYYGGATTTALLVGPVGSYYDLDVFNASSSLQEYSIPVNPGETIHKGDELWAYLYPSWSAYGADHWIGGSGGMPFLELCEGSCEAVAPTTSPPCAANCESNVLFIPGTESSRLYQNTGSGEQKIWEPAFLSNQPGVEALDLKSDGTSIAPTYTKANGAIDTIGFAPHGIPIDVTDIYRTFLQQLAQLKASSTIADYLVFPYDWRMSPEDVVNNGTLYDDGLHHLDTELATLAATSHTGKVTIVAHSNGGLVAKALMNKLAQEGEGNLVDKIILVAVPQDGTPAAISVLLHGDQTGIPPYVVSQATARGLGQYMPDAYDLLPSAAYFSRVATPVVDLTNAPGLRSTAGFTSKTVTSIGNLQKFLTGAGGRTQPASSDVEIPEVISKTLLAGATSLHNGLDAWTPPTGVQVIQIAGWGVDTASGVVYTESNEPDCTYAITCTTATTTRHTVSLTEDGDGTVVIPSAIATSSWPTYYINFLSYGNDTHKYFEHDDITEIPVFKNFFSLLLSSSSPQSLPVYVTTIEPSPTSNEKSLRLRVLSPVSLDVYDSVGNHTGIAPGQDPNADVLAVDQQIPGSYYQRYGEGQYIGLPASGIYNVKLHGTGTGIFTFEITPVSGGTAGTPVSFSGIPVTASSTVAISINSSSPASTSLLVDENGDGKTDMAISSATQLTDPLAYTKMMFTSILGMSIGPITKIQFEAKIMNVGYLIARSTSWNNDDGDPKNTNTKDTVKARVLRKLNLIEMYVENEVTKPMPKLLKAEQLTPAQGSQILGMIEELEILVNAKL